MQTYPPGTRIGQYEIASRPMMGGMGVVYFALDHANGARPVALKTFRPELLPDRAARDRFLREGTAWVELGRHPHIVSCYQVEYIDPTAFLALELIAKEEGMSDASLQAWLNPGYPLPLEQALPFALQIVHGMKYATEKIPGLVHRDLKPGNILVGADKLPGTTVNRLRITDFGLAGILTGFHSIVDPGTKGENLAQQRLMTDMKGFGGTPEYASPEQFESKGLDQRSDHYAFGCILYEMLTGRAPFVHQSETRKERQLMYKNSHLHEAVKPPRSIVATIPDDIDSIIMVCLQKNPGERYENWGEIEMALTRAYGNVKGTDLPVAIDKTEQLPNEQLQEGLSYNALGIAYQDMGKADMAIEYYDKALMLARKISDRDTEAKVLGDLGTAYADLGNARKAIFYYEQALAITRETGDRRKEGKTLSNLGYAYTNLGDARRAIRFCEQALAIARALGNSGEEVNALDNLGIAYHQLGDFPQAIHYFEQALAIDSEIRDRRGQSANLGYLGNAYLALGNLQRAITCFDQGLRIAKEIGDQRREGTYVGNLGIAYSQLGNIQEAIKCYEYQLNIAQEIGDPNGECAACGNLGNAYVSLGNLHKAIDYYERALTISHEIGNLHSEGIALGSLGSVYADLGYTHKAISYQEKALKISRSIGDMNSTAIHLCNLAQLHAQAGDLNRAVAQAQESAQIFTKIGSPNAQRVHALVAQFRQMASKEKPGFFDRWFGKKG
ncbi:MAG TPA: tetratricopeptide repeat protein [Anaerolineales bacterium]|nr:tetratricopeptide repeat protein [Anaerolineales bacterium]HLO30838.1 tetratricopeptide repeat protein [Anaerolineales bacterium]